MVMSNKPKSIVENYSPVHLCAKSLLLSTVRYFMRGFFGSMHINIYIQKQILNCCYG